MSAANEGSSPSAGWPHFTSAKSRHNRRVPIEDTVAELYHKLKLVEGWDGCSTVQVKVGLLRRLGDHFASSDLNEGSNEG